VDGDAGAPGVNPDTAINGGTTSVSEIAFTNNQANTAISTLYTLDAATDSLFIQNSVNGGTQTSGLSITLNGAPLDFTAVGGFDIAPGVNAPGSGSAVAAGEGYAILTLAGGVQGLFRINLATGAASIVPGAISGVGLAIEGDAGGAPAIALSSNGASLVRFNTADPGTTTTVAITGVALFEQVVAIDWRPQTGQLYALGVNPDFNNATLYVIDPQTGAATWLGVTGQIAFVNGSGNPVDLPTGGYGFDFNPTTDRIRVTTETGLNFRINPNSGAAVDGDPLAAGVNPDTLINNLPPGSTGVVGVAYTNSFGQALAGGATTQYTLDPAANTLAIQSPPNNGTQANILPVTLNGSPLDFTAVAGFDIPSDVTVTTSGAAAEGYGYAVLTVGGVTSLYRINLATAAAVNLGGVGNGAAAMAGLALGNAPSNLFTDSADSFNLPYGGAPWYARGGADSVAGTVGTDIVYGENGNDTLIGLGGNDLLDGGAGADSLLGGSENDTLIGGAGADVLNGGAGTGDIASYRTAPSGVAVYVGAPSSSLGDAAGDTFTDIEIWELTNFALSADTFFGGSGAERVFGLAGNDALFGNAGNDTLDGGDGADFLLPGAGADSINGGNGFDAVYYGDSAAGVTIDLSVPAVNTGFAAGDVFTSVESFLLTEQGDLMRGQDADGSGDILYGLGGADWLEGKRGFDWLLGGDGADTLNGGFGYDLLTGGGGADLFVYNNGFEGGAFGGGGEVITDFQVGQDRIAFIGATSGFVSFTLGQNLVLGAVNGGGINGATTGPVLIYDASAGALWFDSNGSTAGGLQYLASLLGAPVLTAADFLVI
jgi:Ca2+-binding RTX toxin-like protein